MKLQIMGSVMIDDNCKNRDTTLVDTRCNTADCVGWCHYIFSASSVAAKGKCFFLLMA